MTAAELRKIERDLSDENSLLRTANARLRSELGHKANQVRAAKFEADHLRRLFIDAQRDAHDVAALSGFSKQHQFGPMSYCANPNCQLATKELNG